MTGCVRRWFKGTFDYFSIQVNNNHMFRAQLFIARGESELRAALGARHLDSLFGSADFLAARR